MPPPPPAPNNRASEPGRGMPNAELDRNNKVWFTGTKWFYGYAIPKRRTKNEVCDYLSDALELPGRVISIIYVLHFPILNALDPINRPL